MPPSNRIEAVTLHNSQQWPSSCWIPMHFEINSWVTLNPDPDSEWGRDSSHYHQNSQDYLWKAQVKAFEFGGQENLVSRVKVRHAYQPRQLYLDPNLRQPRFACNYLFPSYFDDWVDPASIVGLVVGMHADVGVLIHHNRIARELRDASTFFYKWTYVPPAGQRLYAELEEIPVPGFASPTWPLPDMTTSESFRAKLRQNFLAVMKPSTGSYRSHIQRFMPLAVFVDLFATARNRTRSPTLFTIKDMDDQVFDNLMDPGWHQKCTAMGDIIRCTVHHPSVVFRFHISRQTLYCNFFFIREKWIAPIWVPIEQEAGVQLVSLSCEVLGSNPLDCLQFQVGTDWPVSHLRQEVQITMGANAPAEFKFILGEPGHPSRKINRRCKKQLTVADVLPPKMLKLKSS